MSAAAMKSSPIYSLLQILCSVPDSRPSTFCKCFIYSFPSCYSLVSKGLQLCQPNSHRLCFLFFLPLLRTSSDETNGQEAGEDGHHTGSPAAAHPATGPAAAGPRGSQDPSAPHARYPPLPLWALIGCVELALPFLF